LEKSLKYQNGCSYNINNQLLKMKNIALLGRLKSLERLTTLANILNDLHSGVNATFVEYTDDDQMRLKKRLRENFDGVVCWVNPVSTNARGEEETRADWAGNDGGLDKLLKRVADEGLHVSAHPDIIEKIGTKRVLFETRNEPWGLPNTHYYKTKEDLRERFRNSISSDKCRILKMDRGSAGMGVWRCDIVEDSSAHPHNNESLVMRIQHAGDDRVEDRVSLEQMLERLEERMDKTGGGVVDMPFLPQVNEGIIRCYMMREQCRGILHQLPLSSSDDTLKMKPSLYPNLNVSKSKRYQTKGLHEGQRIHPPDSPEYQELVVILENDWVPKLVRAVGLLSCNDASIRDALPVVWDIDFICRTTESVERRESDISEANQTRDKKYILCEINCSCVFPSELMSEMATEIATWADDW